MGFNAADIEKLEYDFTAFGGKKNEIPEPSSDQVSDFWTEYIGVLRISQARAAEDASKEDEIPASDEERDERIKQQIINGQHRNTEILGERRRLLAELCSQQPSEDELAALPHRILNAFEGYLMGKLSPEAWSAATTE